MFKWLAALIGGLIVSQVKSKAVEAVTHPVMDTGLVAAMVEDINRAVFANWFAVADVMAIIEIESSFRPTVTGDDGVSFGLMQIQVPSARDRGFVGPPRQLLEDPALNIRLGMSHLKWTFDYLQDRFGRAPTIDEWIGGYNAGVGNVSRGFIPTSYVAKWRAARARY